MKFRQARRTAALALLLATACGGRPDIPAGPSPRPAVQLDSDGARALALLLRMEDTRTFDPALAEGLLESGSDEVRARVALAAGRLRDPAATPLLLRAATDSSEWVRGRAAFALGQSGDTTAPALRMLEHIALTDRTGPAIEAVSALGRTGAPAARSVIDSLMTDRFRHPTLRAEAATAAWRLEPEPGTIARLATLADEDDAEIRWRATYSLARNGSVAAVPVLVGLVADSDHRVRANAARGLRAAHADSAGVADAAYDALLVAVADSHPHVRINALRSLPGYERPDRTTPVLTSLLRDTDANVAIAAALVIGPDDSGAATALAEVARDAALPVGLRTAALAALARVDVDDATALAVQWTESPEWLLRQHAARTLARTDWQTVAAPLELLARDRHHLVATEALSAIRTLTDSTVDTRRTFIEALGAQHVLVRAAAARGLLDRVSAADLDLLLQAYDRARQDGSREAAVAILTALQRVAEDGTPVDRTFFLRFGDAGPPRDAVLYRTIVQRIGQPPSSWESPDTAREVRPVSFYDDVVRSLVVPVLAGGAAPHVTIGTRHGEIVLELASTDAPLTVHNILSLIRSGYYTGTRWHRVVPNFVIQDGDPRGDGSGGPGWSIRDEINPLRYLRGTLGMALSGPDTGGGQYFITHSAQPHLDGGYTVFGRVVAGMDAVDRVVQEEDILYIRIRP